MSCVQKPRQHFSFVELSILNITMLEVKGKLIVQKDIRYKLLKSFDKASFQKDMGPVHEPYKLNLNGKFNKTCFQRHNLPKKLHSF